MCMCMCMCMCVYIYIYIYIEFYYNIELTFFHSWNIIISRLLINFFLSLFKLDKINVENRVAYTNLHVLLNLDYKLLGIMV